MKTQELAFSKRLIILSFAVLIGFLFCEAARGETAEKAPVNQSPEGAKALLKQGRFADAEVLAREMLRQAEEAHGPQSPEAAQVLDILVEALTRGGKAEEPESKDFAERAVRIKEKALGPDHPDVAVSLNNLASLLRRTGDYAEAKRLHERALEIREKALGPGHPDVARSLNSLANLLTDMGNRAEAKRLYERALEIREKALGPEHPDVATSLNGLATVLSDMGDYAGAKRLHERTLEIREKVLGPEHPDVAASLNNLAIVLHYMSDYAGAKRLHERALKIWEKALGPEHPDVATNLNNLGCLLYDMGDFAGAKPLHERALKIREKALGPEHPDVATSLNNLANLLSYMGDYSGEKPLRECALKIWEKALGPEHPDVALGLDNLGLVLRRMGDYAGAKPLLERALKIREKVLAPEHSEVALSLSHLADMLHAMGDYAGAKSLNERALKIFENAFGQEHPIVAESLHGLADSLFDQGNHVGARPLYERAVRIRERVLGEEDPRTAKSLAGLARTLRCEGNDKEALDAALRAEKGGREHMRLTARSLPERQALRYASVRASGLDVALSVSAEPAGQSTVREIRAFNRKSWDALIRSRALLLDEMAERHRTVFEAGDPEIDRLAETLMSARQRLANLYVRGPGDLPVEHYRGLIDGARKEKEGAEETLARKSIIFRQKLARGRAGFDDVASSLPLGSALVSFARYEHYPVAKRAGTQAKNVTSYMAFVLGAGRQSPVAIPLGKAEEIERLVSRWSEEAGRGVLKKGRSPEESEAACREAGRALREKIWDPITPHLDGAKRVFVIPDGALHLVTLASLPAAGKSYLVEKDPLIHYLSAERDIPAFAAGKRKGEGLLVVGGPAFDEKSLFASLAPGEEKPKETGLAKLAALLPFRGTRSGCANFGSMRFESLPGTVVEAQEIADLWTKAAASGGTEGVTHLSGAGASEAAFKAAAPGRRVLHLATHGFFLGGDCKSALQESRGVGGLVSEGATAEPVEGEKPLLLSGFALAGANHREAASAAEEDGILTAEEIAALDLSGVEWAVLSACDTGVGEVRAGEGVFGLRRAFQVAGAGTLIMSLWSVEDEWARQWMKALYEARLGRGKDTAESVREASLAVLNRLRAERKSTHPFYWAGFVAAGDWK